MSKVLFVGSDRELTDMIARLLRRNGFEVQCAVGRNEIREAVITQQPRAVVADLEMTGFELTGFCRELKKQLGSIRLLLISESEDDEIPVLNAGADDWIKKPYQPAVLYARLKALLRL